MLVKTVVAPYLNVNDLEMKMVCWHIVPWQKVTKGDILCEVESTKAVTVIEAEGTGYIYPVVDQGKMVKVGEPLAHVFSSADPAQLSVLEKDQTENVNVVVTNKARALMKEFGFTKEDFPRFSTISSETVIAKLREREMPHKKYDEAFVIKVIEGLVLDEKSVVLYGEKNIALLAMDAFISSQKLRPVAYLSSGDSQLFYGLPQLPGQALELLTAKGLRKVFVCGRDVKETTALVGECDRFGLEIVSAVHCSAVVSTLAFMGKGVLIGAMAAVGPDVKVGDYCHILSGATVAHHSRLGQYAVISDGAHLGGNVVVGDRALVGIGAVINKRINVGNDAVIVSGGTVIDHVPEKSIVRLSRKDGLQRPFNNEGEKGL